MQNLHRNEASNTVTPNTIEAVSGADNHSNKKIKLNKDATNFIPECLERQNSHSLRKSVSDLKHVESIIPQNPLKKSEHNSKDEKIITFQGEEFYVEKCSNNRTRTHCIYPFFLNGMKYYEIDQDSGFDEVSGEVNIENITVRQSNEVRKRLSLVLTTGINSLSKVTSSFGIPGTTIPNSCHSLANYLAFGMKEQQEQYYYYCPDWYTCLPFAEHFEFKDDDLRFGDIVQFLKNGGLLHSCFYIGNGKFINKHSNDNLFFQSINGIKKEYDSDTLRIIRLKPDYCSREQEFKLDYKD